MHVCTSVRVCTHMCVYMCTCACHSAFVEVRRQFVSQFSFHGDARNLTQVISPDHLYPGNHLGDRECVIITFTSLCRSEESEVVALSSRDIKSSLNGNALVKACVFMKPEMQAVCPASLPIFPFPVKTC